MGVSVDLEARFLLLAMTAAEQAGIWGQGCSSPGTLEHANDS